MIENNHLAPGATLHGGTYRVVRFLSQGGFGCTYEVEHSVMQKRMAVKEFFPGTFCNRQATGAVTLGTESQRSLVDKLRRKFLQEARSVYELRHANIVRVTDVFEENGTAYFAMDYIDGPSLSDLVSNRGPLPEAEALGYIRQVCDALDYVHGENMLHLDIKPANIMVNSKGQAILIDFGVAKQYDEENGQNTSTLMGFSQGFAPTEQSDNNVGSFTPATDIYALGATLYYLLTGKTPTTSTMRASGNDLDPLPATVSATTAAAIDAAMTLNRKQRPQTISEFRALLDGNKQAADRTPKNPKTPTTLEDATKPFTGSQPGTPSGGGPRWKTYAAIAAAIAVVGVVSALVLGNKKDATDPQSPQDALIVVADTAALAPEQPAAIDQAQQPAQQPAQSGYQQGQNGMYKAGSVEFRMVYVAGGTFMMGSIDSEADSDERPVHQVTLSGFSIGQTEVTQALWKAVMGSNPSHFKGDNLPVENVSWDDCQEFIRKLNEMTGCRFRLPTEAEWEYAARGGNRSQGYKYSGSNTLADVAWYTVNSSKTHPVGTKAANELGIYDMSGNVWEWCSDRYGSYGSGAVTNPDGPSTGSSRVYRGGSWGFYARYCRSAARCSSSPDIRHNNLGFRLAL